MVRVPRYSVWGVELSPTKGSEQAGYRPVVVLSPDVMNDHLNTVIVAPMTTVRRDWPTRIPVNHGGKDGDVALDQLRTIDKTRLKTSMGSLHGPVRETLSSMLSAMFTP